SSLGPRACRGLSPLAFACRRASAFYALSLHDALPISTPEGSKFRPFFTGGVGFNNYSVGGSSNTKFGINYGGGVKVRVGPKYAIDRKSTRLNSSHDQISYAVLCLKKKTPTGLSRAPES